MDLGQIIFMFDGLKLFEMGVRIIICRINYLITSLVS